MIAIIDITAAPMLMKLAADLQLLRLNDTDAITSDSIPAAAADPPREEQHE
jgi:hypothetical protein